MMNMIMFNERKQEYKMKRSLFVLTILLLSFGLANAVDFDVQAGPYWDDGGTPTLNANAASFMEVYMHNTPGEGARMGYSMPLMIYGDAGPITYIDMGGAPETGGALVINPDFQATGSWLPSLNTLNIFSAESWDGVLPDTFNHTTTCIPITGCPGWTDDQGNLLVYTLHFVTGDFPVGEPHEICIDSIGHSNATYDWLWSPLSGPFNGPYCFPVEKAPNLAPTVVSGCPTVDIELQWNEQVSVPIVWEDPEMDALDAADANIGDVTIDGYTTTWTFNPDCGLVGSHSISVEAVDATHALGTGNTCDFTVSVLNTPPTIGGDCGLTFPCSIAGTATANFTAADVNGDVPTINLVDDAGGAASLVGGVVTFDGATAGEGTFEVVVQAEDCAGALSDPCSVYFNVVSELPFEIMITKEEDVFQGHHRMVDVVLTGGTNDMYGFDFVIGYDASAIAFMGAVPGVLFDMPGTYEWEYFTYRFGPDGNCGNACPSGFLRVVGMADQNDGPHHPLEVSVPIGTVLFSLDFLVSNDRLYECQYVPIKFFWTDCGDNTIAYHSSVAEDPLEILLAVSDSVFFYVSTGVYLDVTDPNYEWGFPTYYGAQEYCLEGEPGKPGPEPFIKFYGGGIDIICADDIDDRGDINLNGISNEIADAVVFVNYFVYGLPAFTINEEGQMAATDVNADGVILSVADLVYLIRVIIGDAMPYDKLSPYATEATFAVSNGMISTDAEIGAALFTFEGDANVSLAPGVAMDMKVGTVDGQTKALVYNIGKEVVSGNVLVTDGKLVSIEAVDYNGNAYKVNNLPTEFTVSQNYPNPFNPATTVAFSLPSQSDWTVTIFNVAGQTVETINGNGVGLQTITWDAGSNASGIYFYKVEAGDNAITKKMVLLK